jgi:hypothetical protein
MSAEAAARYRKRHPERVKTARAASKERGAAWRAANRERLNAWNREWYAKNREKVRVLRKAAYDPVKRKKQSAESYARRKDKVIARHKKWRADNPEKCKELKRDWIEKNKEYYLARSAEFESVKRATARQATPKWANKFFMREIYHLAQLRTKHLGVKYSVDHIVPLQSKTVCGLHVENNLKIIPSNLNISKGNRVWPDMPGA